MRLALKISLLALHLFLLSGCFLSGQLVTVTIPEIGTSASYDPATKKPVGITDEFLSTAPQITVYFVAKTTVEMDVTYSWYHEGTLIAEFTVPLDQGYNFGWITPKEGWPVGDYKVEVGSGTLLYRDVSFRVLPR